MVELEKKIKHLNHKHEKDLKEIEDTYTEKIKLLSKKIKKYEETIKHSNSNLNTTRQNENDRSKAYSPDFRDWDYNRDSNSNDSNRNNRTSNNNYNNNNKDNSRDYKDNSRDYKDYRDYNSISKSKEKSTDRTDSKGRNAPGYANTGNTSHRPVSNNIKKNLTKTPLKNSSKEKTTQEIFNQMLKLKKNTNDVTIL